MRRVGAGCIRESIFGGVKVLAVRIFFEPLGDATCTVCVCVCV